MSPIGPVSPVALRVYGTPGPQGSKRHVGGGRMVESSKKVGPWREAVVAAAIAAGRADADITCPVVVTVQFYFARPKAHYTAVGTLKPSAPGWVTTTPDLDKCLRSTFDGLVQAGVIRDDKQIVRVMAEKRYVTNGAPGAVVSLVEALDSGGGE